ncbi:fms-related tyrosine kinase 3 ligand isoform X2 [Hemicordylus capensis]|uniref:fms-related tyrosine kinase 3 ligand isoform X2 n=1 Tax=Hemicordylus capensis TaxID=884348 RepID=UPI00230223F2|nr:fms-related tyrosine kinase 3 ligand isoform X2 [Hemicordylus capensis]XP_053118509.1 fms-related tyrosine kinase 3 ligand isoform X2 [Hemicordylus capensis]
MDSQILLCNQCSSWVCNRREQKESLATRRAAGKVFLLLLLCFTPSDPDKNCFFAQSPFPTTNTHENVIQKLRDFLLLDYPVSEPSNLKQDDFCRELWELHFINRTLTCMENVAGKNLSEFIKDLKYSLDFFDECIIEDGCVRFKKTNISQVLDSFSKHYTKLRTKMGTAKNKGVRNFSNCTFIQCQPEPHTIPVTIYTAPRRKDIQPSQPTSSGRSYWGWPPILLVFLPFMILLCSKPLQRHLSRQEPETLSLQNIS